MRYTPFIETRVGQSSAIDIERAIELAREFVAERDLYVLYHDIETHFCGAIFELSFVNRLGGLKNYSWETVLRLDRYGRVLDFTFSDMTFERLSTHSIVSMKEASTFLPTDIERHAHITSAELVYTFENSIVQPAYLFHGKFENGATFRSFVPAAQF